MPIPSELKKQMEDIFAPSVAAQFINALEHLVRAAEACQFTKRGGLLDYYAELEFLASQEGRDHANERYLQTTRVLHNMWNWVDDEAAKILRESCNCKLK